MHADRRNAGIVLLVDDNPDTLRVLINALEGVGLTALVARDGGNALALLERIEPDVILLDAVMPEMDGFELCRQIKKQVTFANTPVLFMTGLSAPEDILAGLNAGGVDYIVKPINPSELIARLTIHLANARIIADARQAIDATGAALFAVGEEDSMAWCSTSAREAACDRYGPEGMDALLCDAAFRDWFDGSRDRPISETRALELRSTPNAPALEVRYLRRNASGEHVCKIAVMADPDPIRRLTATFPLSQREGEVLFWVARGKANRDIADILKISPRTVTKHVEQVLSKLGVENRTAAAVMALARCQLTN